ncbi:MAG TPA: hypothetical protein VGD71_41145, partial [Kribbella sp.]
MSDLLGAVVTVRESLVVGLALNGPTDASFTSFQCIRTSGADPPIGVAVISGGNFSCVSSERNGIPSSEASSVRNRLLGSMNPVAGSGSESPSIGPKLREMAVVTY